MKITVEKFNEAFARFADEYLMPNSKNPGTLFKIGFARGVGRLGLDDGTMAQMRDVGVIGADGLLDLDMFRSGIMSGVEAAGELYISKLGVHLNRQEVEKLLRLVETGSLS